MKHMLQALKQVCGDRTPLIIGILGAGGLILVGVFGYWPLANRFHEQQEQLLQLETRLATAKRLEEEKSHQEQAMQGVEAQYQRLGRFFNVRESLVRTLEFLSQEAQAHHLELVMLQPSAEQHALRSVVLPSGVALREIPVTLHLRGRYRLLGEFLGRLTEAPFLISVRHMTITPPTASSAGRLEAECLLHVYLAQAGG